MDKSNRQAVHAEPTKGDNQWPKKSQETQDVPDPSVGEDRDYKASVRRWI